jgi:hypothetical protein
MKRYIYILIFFFLFCSCINAEEPIIYTKHLGASVIFGWDKPSDYKSGDIYEYKGINANGDTVIGGLTENFQTLSIFIIWGEQIIKLAVRSKRTINGILIESDWTYSDVNPGYTKWKLKSVINDSSEVRMELWNF